MKPQYRVNREIQAPKVRVIGEDGRQIGIMSLQEALRLAYEKDLDLVEVAPDSDPPVCKLMDYEKFLYERARRERESRKARKGGEVKEIRLRPSISEHDLSYRIEDIRDFLKEGNKVRVRVMFKGREIDHPEMALKLLERIMAGVSDVARVDQRPQSEGGSLVMILASK
ncbi:MAG: translation initiation factor IF-3 [Anaerolineae bacterium]|nr:translation initiation factor IF-3 [Anaerolineae bacterium]MDW8102167.1 translation initiation factor IF-3 [Anaerolineae bacterium]